MDETDGIIISVPIGLLHRIDGLLGLGVHRVIGPHWKEEASEVIDDIRKLMKEET